MVERIGWRSVPLALAMAGVLVAGGCSSDAGDEAGEPSGGDASSEAPAQQVSSEVVEGSFDQLDEIVEEVMGESDVPGVAVAVVYGDEVVYEQGYGVRSVDGDDPVTPDTVFQIASLSKPISSTIMSGLVGDGVFEWDDPIHDHAPQFQLSDPWVTEHVTFADLFSHRSGLPGGPSGNDLEAIGYSRSEILPRLSSIPLEPFRDTYSYSNFGMTLGGEAAAVAAGSDWETLADEVLFEPLGMERTSMRHDDLLAADEVAALHVPRDDGWEASFERIPDPQAPAGGVSSTASDLAQWVRLTLAGGEYDGEVVIDPEALAQTKVPHILTTAPAEPGGQGRFYGLGWAINTEPYGDYVSWGHAGAFSTGASTMAKLLPAEDIGIVVLTNGAPVGVPETIADAYLDVVTTGEANTAEWWETWSTRMGGVYGEPFDLGEVPAEPAPAQPNEAYVGTYANPYVGEVAVVEADGGLAVVAGPWEVAYELTHLDGDRFTYVGAPELPEFLELATFEVVDGQAVSVTLSSFDGAEQGTLERV